MDNNTLENMTNPDLMMDHEQMRQELENEQMRFESVMGELVELHELDELKSEVFIEEIEEKAKNLDGLPF